MSEMPISDTDVNEVEITYTSDEILEKLHHHQINPQNVFLKLKVDIARLSELHKQTQTDSFLFKLCEALRNWNPHNNATSFTASINQLIFLWLNAVENGANTQTILNILKCFQLNRIIGLSSSPKFHLFMHDIVIETLHKYHQIALDYVLNYDENIQLPNTKQILPNLEFALSQVVGDQITALLSLHFQTKNNRFLLPKLASQNLNKQLAEILKKNIGENAQLYFIGDSQFEIVISKANNTMQLDLLAAKVFRAFEEMIFIDKHSILVKPFIGTSYSKANKLNANEMYHNAKLALEHAISKQQFHVVYSVELEQSISDQIILESKVLEAFDSNNLTLSFQPIVTLKNTKCVGAELLLRWSDKFGYNIAPTLAIEVLNNAGKGKIFTRWLINSACRYAHELTEEHKLDAYLTLNLRAEDLYDIELPSLFSNALSLWKLDPKSIILEITENGILENNDHTNSVIYALSELGFKFALDDFGTGFSSLTRLRTLPIDLIKIDQSFVKNINNSEDDFKIVQSIAMLANSLGKEVLAEGVENEECLALISKLKIDKCQGYYFAKAMPYEDFIKWAQAH